MFGEVVFEVGMGLVSKSGAYETVMNGRKVLLIDMLGIDNQCNNMHAFLMASTLSSKLLQNPPLTSLLQKLRHLKRYSC